MMTRTRWFRLLPALALLAIAAAMLFAAACSGGNMLVDDKYAWRLEGGALTDYDGTDGEDADARNLMRLVLVGRQFDFTPADSHTVEPGASHTYRAGADADFADAEGTQNQVGDAMTAQFSITTTAAGVADVQLAAEFSKGAAEAAYGNPSQSCEVTWTLSYTLDGEARELTAKQSLIGINYILD